MASNSTVLKFAVYHTSVNDTLEMDFFKTRELADVRVMELLKLAKDSANDDELYPSWARDILVMEVVAEVREQAWGDGTLFVKNVK